MNACECQPAGKQCLELYGEHLVRQIVKVSAPCLTEPIDVTKQQNCRFLESAWDFHVTLGIMGSTEDQSAARVLRPGLPPTFRFG